MFELNITAEPPPIPKRAKPTELPAPARSKSIVPTAPTIDTRQPIQPIRHDPEALSVADTLKLKPSNAKKRKASAEHAQRAAATSDTTTSRAPLASAAPKRARYQSLSADAPPTTMRKEDPARAAPLPTTPSLDVRGTSTFSATSFAALDLDRYLLRHLTERMELQQMTPVQQHTIPMLTRGGDVLVRSPTGSGKTLAYAIPIVQSLLQRGSARVTRAAGTFAVVLVPTRELCLQTHEVIRKLTTPYPWLVTSTLMGGERKKAEKARLRKGVTLLVGTPGRVADHIESTSCWALGQCAHLVLDEADRLLDLGFVTAIESILNSLDERREAGVPRRQTVLLSATLTKGLRDLAGRSLVDYATLQISADGARVSSADSDAAALLGAHASGEVGTRDDDAAHRAVRAPTAASEGATGGEGDGEERLDAPAGLVQSYVAVPTKARLTALIALLRSRSAGSTPCKAVVFVSSCDSVDFLYELLGAAGAWPDLHQAAVDMGHAAGNENEPPSAVRRRATELTEEEVEGGTGEGGDSEAEWQELEDGSYRRVPTASAGGGVGNGKRTAQGGERADGISFACSLLGTTVLRLHGKMSQRERTQAFVRFRDLHSGVLLSTDVAARGLNLQGVHWIVQYDLPQDAKEYLHRAGRTARLGQSGHAVLMLHPSELAFLQLLRTAGVCPRELKFASLQAALVPGGSRRDIYLMEIGLQRQLEAAVRERAFLQETAAAAYQSFVRGYTAHSRVVQRVVHVAQLHLGHLAKSFGLKDIPSKVVRQQQKRYDHARPSPRGGKVGKLSLDERLRRQPKRVGAVGAPPSAGVSEFGAGLL